MKQGTTPTHRFVLPFALDEIEEVEITYCQNGREILKKHMDNCTLEEKTISTTLTQEDTFEFQEGSVEIQIRVKTNDGTTLASDIKKVSCKRCLSDEVL